VHVVQHVAVARHPRRDDRADVRARVVQDPGEGS
jgi:hypothetical protein